MDKFALEKNDIRYLIDKLLLESNADENNGLDALIENSRSWENPICIVSYLLSQVLESLKKVPLDCEDIVCKLYSLPDEFWIEFWELDVDFIKYIMQHTRCENVNIQDMVKQSYENFGKHNYGSIVCH